MNVRELQSYLEAQFGENEAVSARAGRDGNFSEKLLEVEMASKMGYLLCQCSWPPQIMVLCENEHVFRCPACQRMRDF